MDLRQIFGGEQLEEFRADIKRQVEDSSLQTEVEGYVEKMILSDLESNPGLLRALSNGGSVDTIKTMKVFGPRIAGEVDHGVVGQLVDDYFAKHHGSLMELARHKMRRG